jgi:excisionase family DNA binding protein
VANGVHRLLTDREVAAVLGVSVSLLRRWRFRLNGGPAFYRVGRLIRYSQDAIHEFLETRRVDPSASSVQGANHE